MAVEPVLAQESKESAKQTAQITNINEYVSVNAAKPGNFRKNETRKTFFSVIKHFFLRSTKYTVEAVVCLYRRCIFIINWFGTWYLSRIERIKLS